MDHLETLRCFVAAADAGGFAVAARRLGCSAAAVTRAIAALEARLGVLLFQRSTRLVRLTEAGERFLADCRPILNDLQEAEQAASGAQAEAQGLLSITAPQMFGIQHVAPIVQSFLHVQPRVQVRTLFVNRLVHLLDEGMDVAIRIAHLPDSGLTAVQVGALRHLVVASPAYVAQHGEPRHPDELAAHHAIGFSFDARAVAPWKFKDGATGQPQFAWISNSNEVDIAAAEAGLGLTRCLAYQAAASLRAGRLRIVLADHELPPVPVHIVYPAGRRAPAKVRAFVEFAREQLAAEPVLRGRGLVRGGGR
ncbi:MAG: LysR family transcriptional regulator [Gammaproteobacteria bacterium]|jgi:DNA-binding transcriptional LysR family regulator|nr:LysR family transcriptional regulator [Gammaproteobacteria bacterium]MBU1506116.1 LysR family transcriptional regulator [Gammaproteobacteria bacterium]MBU2119745.1 LysR family transcriptional regulator [Gammaproteobacteria bacterium]MBU2170317.1 LysR family transcriptional regulator [Gammaproteobacteria bacterium]MBU2202932.1 LysR family transcriptional regulator [Gammaproteobacteria bacterium]